MTCNLALYEGPEKKKKEKKEGTSYSKLIKLAHAIAEDMSDEDKLRLQANPTPEMLKKIMEKNNG